MKKIVLFIALLHIAALSVKADGYKLEINISGVRDSMLILAMHNGNTKYALDTAYLDTKGKAVFSKKKALEGGMYIIAMNGAHLFDFLISDDKHQTFSMSAIKDDYSNTLRFKNSPENEEFANFVRYMAKQQRREIELNGILQKAHNDEQAKKQIIDELVQVRKDFQAYVTTIANKLPGSLLLSLAKTMDRLEIPEYKADKSNPKYDSLKMLYDYEFQKNHFFDNYNFTDKRLLNTPVFMPTLDYYFDNVLIQTPDSITPMIDMVLNKAKPSADMTKAITGHLLNKYLESKVMGMEAIAIYIIDNYYLKGTVSGLDSVFLSDITRFANQNRTTLIGNYAFDLKMESITGQYESLYNIDAPYMVVYFFDPICGHCKKETPKLYKVYEKYLNKGLKVFAVYTQQDKQEWQSYIAKNGLDWINVWDPQNINRFRIKYDIYSSPQIFLLDKDKKIIGRRLDSENLDKLLEYLFNKK